MNPIAPTANLTAATYLLNQFRATTLIQNLGNRFAREVKDEVTEAHLENLANPSLKLMTVASLYKNLRKPIVLLCPDPHVAQKYRFELAQLLPLASTELYPVEEFTPYDLSSPPVASLKDQYRILNRLKNPDDPFILLLSPKSLLMRHLSLEESERHALHLKTGDTISPDMLTEQCLSLGYVRTSLMMGPGEFSSRGDIFDLYPVNGTPVRIEFFGDTVESIREVDIDNQRSIRTLESIHAIPRASIILTVENKSAFSDSLMKKLEGQKSKLTPEEFEALETTILNQLQALEQKFHPDGIDYYGPLIHFKTDADYHTIVDYLPTSALVVFDDWHVMANHLEGLSDRLARQYQEGIEKGRLLDIGFEYHLSDEAALAQLKARCPRRLFLDSFPLEPPEAAVEQPTEPVAKTQASSTEKFPRQSVQPVSFQVGAPDQFKADLSQAATKFSELRRKGFQVSVVTDHPQRLLDACKENDVPAIYWPEEGVLDDQASWQQGQGQEIIVTRTGPQEGYLLTEAKFAHFTDTELFGRKLKKVLLEGKASKRDDIDVINSIHDLRPGDYVVHVKHGIGQFVETTRIQMDGETREYLAVQYSGSDKLYVPVDQVNLLSRYRGAGDAPPKLSKMGGAEWSSVKKKVKKSIQSIAKDLMELYAKRSKVKGHMFDADSPWQVEMEEAFPYTETPDQWQAILDVKDDMESDRPMDRLICGDVGYGKTEVAIRAIFKAVLSGKQVAVLVPTTILAQQHFNNLSDRFKPYPVKVGLLSRFRSPKEQKEVVNRLILGECDVVVGTHRLLQKDIKFKDLGLLVVDEEQRFGVSHKEKIKHMRAEVDVLTLSATPIPRTLYMSLSGVRQMSIINTPPVNRSPIQTFVGPYNPAQIRMAVLQEIDRGGQVYFVHNRVQTIYQKTQELQDLIPEVRFRIGHGQMSGDELESVMLDFAQHQFDVLVCTTIIENGLDIPNVNTIIVDRADRFGLAQLYQIRGRVGRSNIQAYSYCYYDPERNLTTDAKDRLRAIREFNTFGSGYQIALRDLEIRGVGNVLGAEQHGHMVAVGFDLYCQMLDETIQELQGEVVEVKENAIIDLNVTAFIPDAWVGDKNVKLTEYKRLAAVDSELALEIIEAEWKDRFGDPPEETRQLMNLVRLRILATDLKIPLVRADDEFIRVNVPYSLQEWLFLQKQLPDDIGRKARWVPPVVSKQGSTPTLLVKHQLMDGNDQVEFLMQLFRHLNKLIQKTADRKSSN